MTASEMQQQFLFEKGKNGVMINWFAHKGHNYPVINMIK